MLASLEVWETTNVGRRGKYFRGSPIIFCGPKPTMSEVLIPNPLHYDKHSGQIVHLAPLSSSALYV